MHSVSVNSTQERQSTRRHRRKNQQWISDTTQTLDCRTHLGWAGKLPTFSLEAILRNLFFRKSSNQQLNHSGLNESFTIAG